MKYQKMPGPRPVLHNYFALWMARRNMSVRKLAGILGCSHGVINNLRHGQRLRGPLKKLLMMFYPDCPVTAQAVKLLARPLPAPVVKGRPNLAVTSPLARLAKSHSGRYAAKKK